MAQFKRLRGTSTHNQHDFNVPLEDFNSHLKKTKEQPNPRIRYHNLRKHVAVMGIAYLRRWRTPNGGWHE